MQLTELYWKHKLNGAKWPRKAFLYKWRFQWKKYLRTSTAEWKIKSCTFRSEWGGIMITYFTSPLSLWKSVLILSSIIFQKSSNINWYAMIITFNAFISLPFISFTIVFDVITCKFIKGIYYTIVTYTKTLSGHIFNESCE